VRGPVRSLPPVRQQQCLPTLRSGSPSAACRTGLSLHEEELLMTPELFEQTLRALLPSKPFRPFEVELLHGERLTVDRPDAVHVGGGAAGFIAEDGEIYFFNWQNTRQMGRDANGVAA